MSLIIHYAPNALFIPLLDSPLKLHPYIKTMFPLTRMPSGPLHYSCACLDLAASLPHGLRGNCSKRCCIVIILSGLFCASLIGFDPIRAV